MSGQPPAPRLASLALLQRCRRGCPRTLAKSICLGSAVFLTFGDVARRCWRRLFGLERCRHTACPSTTHSPANTQRYRPRAGYDNSGALGTHRYQAPAVVIRATSPKTYRELQGREQYNSAMRSVIVALALSPAATALRPSPALRHSRRVPPLQNYAAAKAAAAAAKGGAPPHGIDVWGPLCEQEAEGGACCGVGGMAPKASLSKCASYSTPTCV